VQDPPPRAQFLRCVFWARSHVEVGMGPQGRPLGAPQGSALHGDSEMWARTTVFDSRRQWWAQRAPRSPFWGSPGLSITWGFRNQGTHYGFRSPQAMVGPKGPQGRPLGAPQGSALHGDSEIWARTTVFDSRRQWWAQRAPKVALVGLENLLGATSSTSPTTRIAPSRAHCAQNTSPGLQQVAESCKKLQTVAKSCKSGKSGKSRKKGLCEPR
jgi:hypothetical protein